MTDDQERPDPTVPNDDTAPNTADDPPPPRPDLDEPTLFGPTTGRLSPPTEAADAPASQGKPTPDEPTVATPGTAKPPTGPDPDEQTLAAPGSEEPTLATPGTPRPESAPGPNEPAAAAPGTTQPATTADTTASSLDEPTIAGPSEPTAAPGTPWPTSAPSADEPTLAVPNTTWATDEPTIAAESPSAWHSVPPGEETVRIDEPTADGDTDREPDEDPDEPTTAVGGQDVTTTGPTVGGWPLDVPEPGELIWQTDTPRPSDPPLPARAPAYYIALGAAVVLVVGLVAALAILTVVRPAREVAGTARPTQAVPEITPPSSASPPPGTEPSQPAGPLAALAQHPLSTATTRMADSTCALPKFDLADDAQATFFDATARCAEAAWRGTLADTGLSGPVRLVTVVGEAKPTPCGEVTPTSPSTQCEDTVYMTPAHLRDTEQNGRYPGRYVGVFLREYAKALQYTTGLAELVGGVTTGSAEDLDTRLAQQATCLAGVTSGALAGRGAVDTNITNEIRARLTTVDAPPDAGSWLDKGFAARQPAACNTWT